MYRSLTITRLCVIWIAFFALSKVAFAIACGSNVGLQPLLSAVWHGMPVDLSTVGYFISVPVLLLWVGVEFPGMPLRKVLLPWHVLTALLAATAVVVDASLYPFWHFKLDATVLGYVGSPADAMASVSLGFILLRLLAILVVAAALAWLLHIATPCRLKPVRRWAHFAMLSFVAVLAVTIRGGVGKSTMNVGRAYHSPDMFMNHTAVNPLFSFIASLDKDEDFASFFNLLPEAEREEVFRSLYPVCQAETADTLFRADRPNVLVILWESGGGAFFSPQGGRPGVMANLERLASEGIYFSHMYSSSFRTDRGMLSALSGWFSYPTTTLMRLPVVCDRLPCLGRSFREQGYDTFFLYGGDIDFTHTSGYLTAGGYSTLISDRDFTSAQRATEDWGVTDSIAFDRLYDEVVARSQSGKPWHGGMLTLSSHEPFKVPYHGLDDPVLNAHAYTDHCLGRLVERLRRRPEVWDNLLLVVLPDHGFCLDGMSILDDLYFRAPMVWAGGAVEKPRVADCIMGQSDLPATLLGALRMPHDDYPYSRNVLSADYKYQFAYSTMREIAVFRDQTGQTVLNVQSLQQESPAGDSCDMARLQRLKAILQTSYDIIAEVGNTAVSAQKAD